MRSRIKIHRVNRKEECVEHVRYGDLGEHIFVLRITAGQKAREAESFASYVINGFLLRVNKD